LSFALNMLLAWIIFLQGYRIARLIGQAGLKASSRVFSLLLAAIAVDMVIRGLESLGIILK
ncbi:MAG: MarC family protein, partial [Dehalococcoidales bacterium]|nr:MarC family protein [Dehalococcoidales bacterium]